MTTKSRSLIIAAALDALSHAIEAHLSRIASPMTEIHSLKAIELIFHHLPTALETRAISHLEKLSMAGTFAAMAFSNASLGLDHALAHSLGGVLDTVHGIIHPILLPQVMRFNLKSSTDKIAQIGQVILGKTLSSPRETALAGIENLEAYFKSLKVSTRLRDIVPDRSKLQRVCEMAALDTCLLSNPRSASVQEMLEICDKVW